MKENQKRAEVLMNRNKDILNISLIGDFINYDNEEPLKALHEYLGQKIRYVKFINNEIVSWDSSLLLIIFNMIKLFKLKKIECDISDLPRNVQDLIGLAFISNRKANKPNVSDYGVLGNIGESVIEIRDVTINVCSFLNEVLLSLGRFFSFKSIMRKTDFLSALDDCGPKALGIVSLISFLVGLILAFVGAVQLKVFGAQIYVASLVTIGMCRIMGAIMVGIIMAGRTGASYAATIGTMQVNEELDALQTMGLSRIDFLVLPRLLSLVITMPLLTMLADFMGILGGISIGVFMMDLPYQEYMKYAMDAFNLSNFLVGIFHGCCFGFIIALCGCYQGLNCGRNADSVGVTTTKSVVFSVVWMIIVTGIITVICQGIGI